MNTQLERDLGRAVWAVQKWLMHNPHIILQLDDVTAGMQQQALDAMVADGLSDGHRNTRLADRFNPTPN